MLERYHIALRARRRGARRRRARRGWPRSPSGSRRSARSSARTCSPTSSAYTLVLEARRDLAGLPDFVRDAARAAADERGMAGKHVITLSRSTIEPFLQFSARRDLREKAFSAWIARGDSGGATDNKAIIAEMVALRAERAQAARLRDLRALPARRHDGEDAGGGARPARRGLAAGARAARCASATRCRRWSQAEGGNFALAPWDWRYYAEKLRKARYDFDEADDQAVPPARPHDRGGVRHRRQAVRPDLQAAHGRRRLASRRAAWEVTDAGRPPRRRCSSATISRAPRSAAAPG